METATMTGEAAATKAATGHIFLRDQYEGGAVLVAKAEWFKWMPLSEIFTDYGQPVEVEYPCEYCDECEEDCEGACEESVDNLPQVRAYSHWDGSNWRSVVLEADDHEPRFAEIDDADEIARYEEALEEMEFSSERGGIQTFHTEDFTITKSLYASAWELYTIEGREEF